MGGGLRKVVVSLLIEWNLCSRGLEASYFFNLDGEGKWKLEFICLQLCWLRVIQSGILQNWD